MTDYLHRFEDFGNVQREYAYFALGASSIFLEENRIYVNVTPEQMDVFKANPEARKDFEQLTRKSVFEDRRHVLVEIPSNERLVNILVDKKDFERI